MFDRRADGCSLRIGSGNALGHGTAVRLALVDVTFEHAPFEEGLIFLRPVGGISPDARAGAARVDQVRRPGTVMGIDGAGVPSTDQPMRPVDAHVVIVTEHRDGEIARHGGLGIV